jgi:hypothetical protein
LNAPKVRWLVVLWLLIIAMWTVSGFALYGNENRGTFGDMFGAINALFTGLAFATLIYTAWMQRDELALQREELQSTRLELQGQKEQLALQNATFALQRFENTFFELLRVHGQIVDSIDLVNEIGVTTRSRDCFKVFYRRLSKAHAAHAVYPDTSNPLPAIQSVYRPFFEENQSEIGHYFRHLYHVIKFIKAGPVENKRQYTSIVRAQLSSYEQVLLFYNCLSEFGCEKFKPLVEEFALLENMPRKLLLMGTMHLPLYKAEAYGADSAA